MRRGSRRLRPRYTPESRRSAPIVTTSAARVRLVSESRVARRLPPRSSARSIVAGSRWISTTSSVQRVSCLHWRLQSRPLAPAPTGSPPNLSESSTRRTSGRVRGLGERLSGAQHRQRPHKRSRELRASERDARRRCGRRARVARRGVDSLGRSADVLQQLKTSERRVQRHNGARATCELCLACAVACSRLRIELATRRD